MFGQNNDDQQDQPQHGVVAPTTPSVFIDEVTGNLLGDKPMTDEPKISEPKTPEISEPKDIVEPSITTPATAETPKTSSAPGKLVEIRKQALKQLTPLVDKLDQNPEEKFRTAMMLIQASDDDSLIQLAFDAAQKIEDEPARAQALLDVVNEINYFTQNSTDAE